MTLTTPIRNSWYNPTAVGSILWKPVRSSRTKSYVTAQDWFCGLGGTAQALMAAGVEVLISGNHDRLAIDVHSTNFPGVEHVQQDIRGVDVRQYPTTDIGVFTSECTWLTSANSKSAIGMNGQLLLWDDVEPDERTKAERSRSLMTEVLRFTEYHRYAIVFVENVVDIFRWANFQWWVSEMQKMGYQYQPIIFNSQFAPPDPCPVPQSRDRYYGVFVNSKKVSRMPDLNLNPRGQCETCRCEINAIQRWKKQARQWGRWNKSYVYVCPGCHREVRPFYYPASSAIDWSLPTIALGEREELGKNPLTATTMGRIRYGIERFGQPILLDTVYTHAANKLENRVRAVDSEPASTLTTRQSLMLAHPPFMVDLRGTAANQIVTTSRPLSEPISTLCAGGSHHMLVAPPEMERSFTVQYYRTATATSLHQPIPTLTGKARHLLVTPGETVDIRDWRTRMLDPDRELKVLMGFPSTYILKGNKREQTALIGRSLNPATVTAIIRRCIEVL